MRRRFSPATFAVLCIAAAPPALAETPVATAIFKCQGGKSIDMTFYASSVDLKLSDGAQLEGAASRVRVWRALRQQGRDIRILEQGRHRFRHLRPRLRLRRVPNGDHSRYLALWYFPTHDGGAASRLLPQDFT